MYLGMYGSVQSLFDEGMMVKCLDIRIALDSKLNIAWMDQVHICGSLCQWIKV